jgi:hypothetical protein
MRGAFAAIAVLLVQALAPAATPERLYYLGEIKLTSEDGKSMGSQVILVEKIHDRDNSTIIERAVVVQANGKVDSSTMRLAVKEDNTFTLTDEANKVEGTGKLFGPAWQWTYFKGTFKAKNGVVIEDENFLADDQVGTARKKVIGPDNQVLMYMDMSLKAITPKTFEILRIGLMRK